MTRLCSFCFLRVRYLVPEIFRFRVSDYLGNRSMR